MHERELKNRLKEIYPIEPSRKEREFLKAHRKTSLNLMQVILVEMRYMGGMSLLAMGLLMAFFLILSRSGSPEMIWYVSGSLPAASLLVFTGLGRSERFGMMELEAVSRFSLRFLRMVRMAVLGGMSLVLLGAGLLLLEGHSSYTVTETAVLIGIPYMMNVWGNLVITRHWRDPENLLGCLGMSFPSCLLPVLLAKASCFPRATTYLFPAVLAVLFVLAVRESVLYIRESEDLTWNFS